MSIIGISGKKTVGKNTIAKIINQLTNNKYEEKCFADKLKDKKFHKIILAHKGKEKFFLKGDYFNKIGTEYIFHYSFFQVQLSFY